MRLRTEARAGQWIEAKGRLENIMAKAATAAIHDVGELAKAGGRASIAAAGFSNRWQRSLQTKMFPSRGVSLSPSVYLHSTINYSDIFEEGGTITGSPFLWLPLPAVPPIAGRPHMTPSQYIKNVGPLRSIRRPGKTPMLAAMVRMPPKAQPFGKFATKARLKRGARMGNKGTLRMIPMFVGVVSVKIPKLFDVIGEAHKAADRIGEFYIKNLAKAAD